MNSFNPAPAGKVLFVGFQLGLLILIVKLFELQSVTFLNLSLLILGGFLIHAFLPMHLRLMFFLLLSLASIILALGFSSGAWVIGLGLVLIGICYLPVKFSTRIALIFLAGGLLAAVRINWIPAPWTATVWPILSAMFMFRLIIYMYDIKHEKGRPDLTRTLSYFFMLPNVIFPLFPVVDYKKFQRNYYNDEPERIYQRGVSWIFRGIIHLLLYRIAYQHLTIDPETVNGLAAVMQFSFSAFLLYLQVSGSFHMIVGILLLFGFNLPETNHLYFLASSFNDFWRRINIYWKDFMMKVFYYPVYFRVKKLGETKAIIISTFAVFFATWLLHAYQWFWLRGTFLLEWHDALYWTILAILVVGNSLYETNFGRARKLGGQSRSFLDHAALACSTLATFLTMGLLWGMWSSDSMAQWVSMWGTTGAGWIVMLLLIPGLFVLSMLFGKLARSKKTETSAPPRKLVAAAPQSGFWKQGIIYSAAMLLVYGLGHETVYSKLPSFASATVEAFRVVKLNARDQAQLERGYYENLIDVDTNLQGSALWQMFAQKPADWDWNESNKKYVRKTYDLRSSEIIPNSEFEYNRAHISMNSWGLRDHEYELRKPEDSTLRIALLGASYVFGPGVNNGETFEAIVEERLNAESDGIHYEVLNFSFPGRSVVSQVQVLDEDVLQFEPDVIILFAQRGATGRITRSLSSLIFRSDDKLPYDYLNSVTERARATGSLPAVLRRSRLAPFSEEVLEWSYSHMATVCQMHGIRPVWIYLPATNQKLNEDDPFFVAHQSIVKRNGFFTMTLEGAYGERPQDEVAVAAWDEHPNVLGHQLLAEKLYSVLTENAEHIFKPKDDPLAGRTR